MAYSRKTIVKNLRKLNDNWNDNYWVFVAGGKLCLMRKRKGERAYLNNSGADQTYISADFSKIEADGGDW